MTMLKPGSPSAEPLKYLGWEGGIPPLAKIMFVFFFFFLNYVSEICLQKCVVPLERQ